MLNNCFFFNKEIGRHVLGYFLKTARYKRYKMVLFCNINIIKVPEHGRLKNTVFLHNVFKLLAFFRFLAFHKRVKLDCKLVEMKPSRRMEII